MSVTTMTIGIRLHIGMDGQCFYMQTTAQLIEVFGGVLMASYVRIH